MPSRLLSLALLSLSLSLAPVFAQSSTNASIPLPAAGSNLAVAVANSTATSSASGASASVSASGPGIGAAKNASTTISGAGGNRTADASTSTSPAVTNVGSNPLIPTTISDVCQSFLEAVKGDAELSSCTTPLLTTLALFAPSTTNSTTTLSADQISSSLDSLCNQMVCSDALVRTILTSFNGNCSAELQALNPVVLGVYDVIYTLRPLTATVCSKDSIGKYCVNDIANGTVPTNFSSSTPSPSSSSAASSLPSSNGTTNALNVVSFIVKPSFHIQSYAGDALTPRALYVAVSASVSNLLYRRSSKSAKVVTANSTQANATAASTNTNSSSSPTTLSSSTLLPNSTTWRSSSLPFLFLSSSMPSSLLCTTCTRSILANYVAWETRMPYALGLVNSPLLGGQGELWSGVGVVCGRGFQDAISVQAGQSALSVAPGRGTMGLFGLMVVLGTVWLVQF